MLKQFIQERNITTYALAKQCGVSYSTLNDIVNGKTDINNVRLGVALKLAQILRISIDELITICAEDNSFISPDTNTDFNILTKNKSYYAEFKCDENTISLPLCKVTEDTTAYIDFIGGWEVDKYIKKKKLEKF